MIPMGFIHAEIELTNADDIAMVKRSKMDVDEVRRMNVNMLVDSGAYLMGINEAIQEQMQFSFIEKKKFTMASGQVEEFDVVGPVIAKFKNRTAICSAIVLEGNSEPLLGSIPMEEMDVLIHPSRQELILNPDHPEHGLWRM